MRDMHEDMVKKAKEQFFADDTQATNNPHRYFLADSQGSKIIIIHHWRETVESK